MPGLQADQEKDSTIEELAQRAGELDLFDTDDEVDEFIAFVRRERDASIAEPRNLDLDESNFDQE